MNFENTFKMMSIGFSVDEIDLNAIKLFNDVLNNSDVAEFQFENSENDNSIQTNLASDYVTIQFALLN